MERIQEAACKIGRAANVDKVLLFGSRARGQTRPQSDVDFVVIAPSELPRFKRSRQLFKPYPFSMDILVYTPDEIERASRCELSFVSTVLREGKVPYIRPNTEAVEN